MTYPEEPLDHAIRPAKQEAQRHYGSHPYFTKRAWNVVQAYIKHFSAPGDTVLDPFGGSGVTNVEALVLGRKTVYVDLNPWACFLARQTALAPVDLAELHAAFAQVEDSCRGEIEAVWTTPNERLAAAPPREWYPKRVRLPESADAEYVDQLFTPRMLHGLAKLRKAILGVKKTQARDLLLMAFSATLVRINRTFLSAANRSESRGGSAIFSIYRYKVANQVVELSLWPQFAQRFRKLVAAKRETNQLIGDFYKEGETATFVQGSATELHRWVKPESVDYIYTDPPYGAHIAYLDLSTMWTAWLKMPVTAEDRRREVIEGGGQKRSRLEYEQLLRRSLAEMGRALKPHGWLSVVFAHRDTSYWEALVSACKEAGFSYQNTVVQPVGVVWSMHKKKNPLKVLSGELVLNFRKLPARRRIPSAPSTADPLLVVRRRCEAEIIKAVGASTEHLHHTAIPLLLEHGLLDRFARDHGDLVPMLRNFFVFDGEARAWHLPSADQLAGEYAPEALARYYIRRYLDKLNGAQPAREQVEDYLKGVWGGRPAFGKSVVKSILDEEGDAAVKHPPGHRPGVGQRELVFAD